MLVVFLAGCGVDGPPKAPPAKEKETPKPGISISGTASVGVTGGSG